jgi:hypothetical protein
MIHLTPSETKEIQGLRLGLSSVLNSERAIEVNIAIMRVFVRLREMMATHKLGMGTSVSY